MTAANVEAEAAVLGLALNGVPAVLDGLLREDFSEPRNADVYSAVQLLAERSAPCDPVTVLAMLRQLGTVPTTADKTAALFFMT